MILPHRKTQRGVLTMKQVCIYHIAEQFLYEYYFKPEDYEILGEDKVKPLLDKAREEDAKGGIMAALQYYQEAEDYNPVSTEIRFHLIDLYFRLHRNDDLLNETKEIYPFCCTRAEIAQYYRWLGYYFLETYKPGLAAVLYRFSTLYEKSELAENEIHFLETAMNKKMPDHTAGELAEKISHAGFPAGPSKITLALVYKAGEEAQSEAGNSKTGKTMRQQALDCYRMVYDLTGDEETGQRIRVLSRE